MGSGAASSEEPTSQALPSSSQVSLPGKTEDTASSIGKLGAGWPIGGAGLVGRPDTHPHSEFVALLLLGFCFCFLIEV